MTTAVFYVTSTGPEALPTSSKYLAGRRPVCRDPERMPKLERIDTISAYEVMQ